MNIKSKPDEFHLRLYDPDGLAAERSLRSSYRTPPTRNYEQDYSELRNPLSGQHSASEANRVFLKTLVASSLERGTSKPLVSLIELPSGDMALALPMPCAGDPYVAALLGNCAGLPRAYQAKYAQFVGGRLARRAENRAVAKTLVDNMAESLVSLTEPFSLFLAEYSNSCILDELGSVHARGNRIFATNKLINFSRHRYARFALVIFDKLVS